MKIIFNRQMIVNAVAPLMCTVSGKSTISAIDGILFEASEDGTCTMTTFDLEKGMKLSVKANVVEPGSYVLNAQKFSQTVRVMEGEEVTLTVTDQLQACIVCGKSSHRMPALAAADFPKIPQLTTVDGFVIGQAIIKEMLSKTMCAMASNDQRPVLNGCYFKITPDHLLSVACDSFKVAKCSADVPIENKNEDGSDLEFSLILPNKTVNELFRMLKDDERETVRVYLTRKTMVFHFEDFIFFSRLIDGVYIDYDRVIMTNHKIFVQTDRETVIAALERAALVTEEKISGNVKAQVRLEFVGDLLKISATSKLGSTYDELPIQHEGDDLVIAFNNRYLIDCLKSCTADQIKISMTSAMTSILIEPTEPTAGKSELFMLLPVRMKE